MDSFLDNVFNLQNIYLNIDIDMIFKYYINIKALCAFIIILLPKAGEINGGKQHQSCVSCMWGGAFFTGSVVLCTMRSECIKEYISK